MGAIRTVDAYKTAGIGDYLNNLRYRLHMGEMLPDFMARGQHTAQDLAKAQLDLTKLTKSNNTFKLLAAGGVGAAIMALLNAKHKRESNAGGAPTIIRYGS